MAETKVSFKRGSTSYINGLPIIDGQILYDTESETSYADFDNRRIKISSAIQDSRINKKNTWSSDKIITLFSSPFEATGNIICHDMLNNSGLELDVLLDKRQSGTGTPSKDNIRNIGFWNELKINVSKKNLLNVPTGNFVFVINKNIYLQPGEYTIFGKVSSASDNYQTTVIGDFSDVKLYLKANKDQEIFKTFQVEKAQNVKISIYSADGYFASQGVAGNVDYFQLELGTKRTQYESFLGKEYVIKNSQKIVGGKYYVDKGILETNWHGVVLDGNPSEDWREDAQKTYLYSAKDLPYAAKKNGKGICNLGTYYRSFSGNSLFVENKRLIIGGDMVKAFGGKDQFLEFIKTHSLEIAYETEAPFTLSTTKSEPAGLGENTCIYTNAGSMTVKGYYNYQNNELVENLQLEIEKLKKTLSNFTSIDLPNYYDNYLLQKIKAVDKQMSSSANTDAFIFVTDNHLGSNTLFSFPCMMRLLQQTSLDKVFYNGDAIVAYGSKEVLDEEAMLNKKLFKQLMPYGRVYLGRGNHDFAIKTSATENTGYTYSSDYAYNMSSKVSAQYTNGVPGKCYFWFDNPTQKIRYICLDTQDIPIKEASIPAGVKIGVSEEQMSWLKATLNTVDDGWSVLVYGHVPIDGALTAYDPAVAPVRLILQDYKNRRGEFLQAKGELIMYLCGHNHRDQSTVSDGVLIVSCACDARYAEAGYPRTLGTTNEISLDVVILNTKEKKIHFERVGAGSNRDFNY